jgi:hypothetical protein
MGLYHFPGPQYRRETEDWDQENIGLLGSSICIYKFIGRNEMNSSIEFNSMVDELISLTNDKGLRNDLSLFEYGRNDLLKKFGNDESIALIEKELAEIEKMFRNDVQLTNRLYNFLLEWQKWQTKADIAYSRYCHLDLHIDRIYLHNLAVISGMSSTEPKYDDGVLPIEETINRRHFDVIKRIVESSIKGAKHSFRTYITHKWWREISRHLFDILIGLVILTHVAGYLNTLIPQSLTVISLFVIPTILWIAQKVWINKWLDKKLEKWREENLLKSINSIFYAKAFVRCYQSCVKKISEDIKSAGNYSKEHTETE